MDTLTLLKAVSACMQCEVYRDCVCVQLAMEGMKLLSKALGGTSASVML